MSDSVQAAAERLRRLYNANDSYAEVYGVEQTGAGLQQRDEQAVVAAYLALHDPTPLDETWLRAVGFEVDVRDGRAPSMFLDRLRISLKWKQWTTWLKTGVNDWITMSVVATRGDVRRLCDALGVTLSEPGGER
jgi:hypothetical protein